MCTRKDGSKQEQIIFLIDSFFGSIINLALLLSENDIRSRKILFIYDSERLDVLRDYIKFIFKSKNCFHVDLKFKHQPEYNTIFGLTSRNLIEERRIRTKTLKEIMMFGDFFSDTCLEIKIMGSNSSLIPYFESWLGPNLVERVPHSVSDMFMKNSYFLKIKYKIHMYLEKKILRIPRFPLSKMLDIEYSKYAFNLKKILLDLATMKEYSFKNIFQSPNIDSAHINILYMDFFYFFDQITISRIYQILETLTLHSSINLYIKFHPSSINPSSDFYQQLIEGLNKFKVKNIRVIDDHFPVEPLLCKIDFNYIFSTPGTTIWLSELLNLHGDNSYFNIHKNVISRLPKHDIVGINAVSEYLRKFGEISEMKFNE